MFLIQSSVDGYLGCLFPHLAIMNNAAAILNQVCLIADGYYNW